MFSHNGLFSLLFLAAGLIIVIVAYLYYLSTQRKFSFVTSPARIIVPLAIILTATELVVMNLISFVSNQHISVIESLIDASILLIVTFPLLYIWLRQQSQQIGVIVRNIVDAVIVINEKGEIEYFNPAAEKIFGYNANEILGKKVNTLMPEPHTTDHDRYLQEYLSTQVPHVINKGRVNLTALRKGGEEFPIYIAINNMSFYGRSFFVASIQDITEQKRTEEKIRLNEEKYRSLFEHNADAIFVADTQTGMIVDANAKATELTGRSTEEILTLHQSQLHPPEELESITNKFRAAVTSPTPITVEANALHKDGRKIPIEISTTFYTDPEGKQRIIGVFRNVSERKEAEEKIKNVTIFLNAILDNAPAAIFAKDADTHNFIFWNKTSEKFFGLSKETVLGKNDYDFFPAEQADFFWAKDTEAMSSKQPIDIPEESITTPDNNTLFLHTKKVPVADESGKAKFLLAVSEDITDRKKTEEKIKQSEARLKEAEKMAHLGHWDWDIMTNELYWSDEIYRIFGLEPQEFSATYDAFLNTIHPDDRDMVIKAVNSAIEGKNTYNIEHRIILPNGTIKTVHEQGDVAMDSSGKVLRMIGIVHDITERKEYEEALEKIKDAALGASRAKSEFLANMSHEIRTPMNTTLGVGELLRETNLTPEQKRYVDMFQKSGEHLLNLINDILDLSKIESGHMELERIDFNLLSIIEHVRSILAPKTREKGIELLIDIDPFIPGYLIGDPQKIKQILINLAGNALKFTQKGSILINAKLERTINRDVVLLFEIKDTGIGIPPDKLDKLFKSFSQVDSSTTRKYGGTGLGLVISKKFIEMMNGHIWVESKVGKGSSFFFDIELEVSPIMIEDGKKSRKKEGETVNNLKNKKLKILVVEDSDDNRQLIKLYLKNYDYHIDEAENGETGLGKMKNEGYDLVLMDIQMPIMDGYDATRLYREWEKKENKRPIPIIGLSANAFKDDREKAIEVGCSEYLTKPVRKKQLLETIEAIIKQ